jgi:hypothetical protein
VEIFTFFVVQRSTALTYFLSKEKIKEKKRNGKGKEIRKKTQNQSSNQNTIESWRSQRANRGGWAWSQR